MARAFTARNGAIVYIAWSRKWLGVAEMPADAIVFPVSQERLREHQQAARRMVQGHSLMPTSKRA